MTLKGSWRTQLEGVQVKTSNRSAGIGKACRLQTNYLSKSIVLLYANLNARYDDIAKA